MKRKRLSEEQIIKVLESHEAGVPPVESAGEHRFAEGTIYAWKAKNSGMDVPEAKRLRELEAENKRLKRLTAEAMLEKVTLKDALGRNW